MKLNRNSKIFINYFLGPILFIWLAWSIYHQVSKQPNLGDAWQSILLSLKSAALWYLVGAILLMVVNWSLEAVKWKIAVRPVQDISFIKSLKAVLSGVSFSVSTPNRVGEYLGRVLYMEEGNRLKTVSLTIVSSVSQLIITLAMGCAGLLFLRDKMTSSQLLTPVWMNVIQYGVLIVLAALTLFYFRLSWIVRWVNRLPGTNRFIYLVKALENFNATLLWQLLSLSLVRFIVFIIQYYLLFRLFNVDIGWWPVFWSVSVSFLIMAVIPSIAIIELVQRGKVITTLVGLYTINELGMTFTTAGIWFINLIIPAITGSLLILGIKKLYSNESKV